MVSELKILRIRKGIKAYELASKVGIHPSKLSLIENGRIQPDPQLFRQLKEALGEDGEISKS